MLGSAARRVTAAVLVLLTMPSVASAATTIGKNDPTDSSFCIGTFVARDAVVPGAGAITSFAFKSATSADGTSQGDQLTFKVLRPQGNNQFLVIGSTGPVTLATGSELESFPATAPVPVQAGDVLGLYTPSLDGCVNSGTGSSSLGGGLSDPPVGTTVTSPTVTPLQTNLSAQFESAPSADLSVLKQGPSTATVGQTLTYGITVANNGPDAATSATLSDTLPAGTTFESITQVSGPAASCTTPAVGSGGTVTCSWATLAAGAAAKFDLVVDVTPSAGSSITNTATVSSSTSDPDPLGNTSSATSTVVRSADLSVTKADSADPVTIGQTFDYTVTAANAGPSPVSSVVVTDQLPPGVTFVSASATQGAYDPVTGQWSVGTLASGQDEVLTITVLANQDGEVFNTASITSGELSDPDDSDDSDTEKTVVAASADLSLTKTDSADPVSVGTVFSYLLDVDNAGPSTATGVTVTDTLPAGVQFVSASPGCTGTTTVVCDLGTIAAGASKGATISVRAVAEGLHTNTATVSSTTGDPDGADNSDTETTRVSGYSCDRKGTAGNDTITGTSASEVICGLGGNDTIRGGGGNDVLAGGDGLDKLYGEAGFDRLNGGIGDDLLDGGIGADNLQGFDGADQLFGQAGTDQLFGQNGNDRLDGGADRDECSQGAGTGSVVSCP